MEAEIELLTKQEAMDRPAGKGQDEPNSNPHLDKPKYILNAYPIGYPIFVRNALFIFFLLLDAQRPHSSGLLRHSRPANSLFVRDLSALLSPSFASSLLFF